VNQRWCLHLDSLIGAMGRSGGFLPEQRQPFGSPFCRARSIRWSCGP